MDSNPEEGSVATDQHFFRKNGRQRAGSSRSHRPFSSRTDIEMGATAAAGDQRTRGNKDRSGPIKSGESANPLPEKYEQSPIDPPQDSKAPYSYQHLPEVKGDPWEEVMDAVNKYDKELCEGWNKDIDSTLIFAGLFSATVTAFTIESRKWLAEEPADATVRLLAQLSQQLGAANVSVADSPPFSVTSAAIRINIFWFLSLIIALSAALIGILCRQWMREYQRDTPISNREAFELRQLRHQSWEYWRVPDIISSTSLLLQLALLLFFAGVIDLLWSRAQAHVVAAVITAAVGLSVLFISITMVLPFAYDLFRIVLRDKDVVEWNNLMPCAYRSPLSRVLLTLSRSMTYSHWIREHVWFLNADDMFRSTSDWSSVDLHLLRHYKIHGYQSGDYLHRGMKWTINTLGDNVVMVKHLFRCMESVPSVVNTLVPHALGFDSSDAPPSDLLRHQAYAQFIEGRGTIIPLAHFYIEAKLRYVAAGTLTSPDIRTIYVVIRQMYKSDLGTDLLPRDLYLLLISISRWQITRNLWAVEDIILHWFPFLALTWTHDDETIRSEGALWASEIASDIPVEMRKLVVNGLSHIISGGFKRDRGKADLAEETRKRIILSEPFRGLFNWAGSHWPNEWGAAPVSSGGRSSPAYNYDLMKDQALRVANLPANYFDVDRQIAAQELNQHSSSSPPARSSSAPLHNTREQINPLVPQLEGRPLAPPATGAAAQILTANQVANGGLLMEAPTLKLPEPRRHSVSETSRVVAVNNHAPDPAITRIPDDPVA